VDAAQSKSSAREKYNCSDRRNGKQSIRRRRQTPLVNWGYATRMQCLWKRLSATIAEYETLQLLILGAGLDRIGFDLVKTFPNTLTSLVEVDLPPICALKRAELIADDGIVETCTHGEGNNCSIEPHFIFKALIEQKTEYSLIALDLNDDTAVENVLNACLQLDNETPLLVLSELVLSYVSPPACDALLSYFARRRPSCSILLYEVLGEEGPTTAAVSVVDNYRRLYGQQFRSKLGTNNNNNNKHDASLPPPPPLYPIGANLHQVQERIHQAGFDVAYATHPLCGKNEELLFDEHAAMALHLQSYVVACGTKSHTTTTMRMSQHRWQRHALQGDFMTALPSTTTTNNNNNQQHDSYRIAPALVDDTKTIRREFAATYGDFDSTSSPTSHAY